MLSKLIPAASRFVRVRKPVKRLTTGSFRRVRLSTPKALNRWMKMLSRHLQGNHRPIQVQNISIM
jgi:hypothetical protein